MSKVLFLVLTLILTLTSMLLFMLLFMLIFMVIFMRTYHVVSATAYAERTVHKRRYAPITGHRDRILRHSSLDSDILRFLALDMHQEQSPYATR